MLNSVPSSSRNQVSSPLFVSVAAAAAVVRVFPQLILKSLSLAMTTNVSGWLRSHVRKPEISLALSAFLVGAPPFAEGAIPVAFPTLAGWTSNLEFTSC